ncbi:uncharacterized protein LOC126993606 [Eriocheir sinensis]|uniref:uncharacterized protein LOC126993606 n=1 Tax=Eriocheir sinensis TaxID=95602 RepID=UPI0021C5A350|nr:uncharacterized protein LOC126993606 [Eriocheir sinensis]
MKRFTKIMVDGLRSTVQPPKVEEIAVVETLQAEAFQIAKDFLDFLALGGRSSRWGRGQPRATRSVRGEGRASVVHTTPRPSRLDTDDTTITISITSTIRSASSTNSTSSSVSTISSITSTSNGSHWHLAATQAPASSFSRVCVCVCVCMYVCMYVCVWVFLPLPLSP